MDSLIELAVQHGDSLGVASILIIICIGLSWLLQKSNKREQACIEERIQTANDIGELREEMGSLRAKVEVQENSNKFHLESLKELHTNILEVVAKSR